MRAPRKTGRRRVRGPGGGALFGTAGNPFFMHACGSARFCEWCAASVSCGPLESKQFCRLGRETVKHGVSDRSAAGSAWSLSARQPFSHTHDGRSQHPGTAHADSGAAWRRRGASRCRSVVERRAGETPARRLRGRTDWPGCETSAPIRDPNELPQPSRILSKPPQPRSAPPYTYSRSHAAC